MIKLLLITILLLPLSSSAEDSLYRWVDDKGVEHFGNQPKDELAEKINPPQITKEDFGKRLEKIQDATPPNCINRGGVDCSKGPDSDGSVICYDDYREAILPFIFACVEAKIAINAFQIILEPDAQTNSTVLSLEELKSDPKDSIKGAVLSMLIRNDTEIKARNMSVTFKTERHGDITAVGPENIEPHGIAEYTVATNKLIGPFTVGDLKKFSATIRCENCNKTIRYRR